ncbi:MAG: DUF2786 domain-containing protein [Actinomycetota bacterium]
MDDQRRQKLAATVAALLAKAASSEFEDEARLFEAKAMELMARYQIEEAELRRPDQVEFGVVEIDVSHFGNAQTGAAHVVWGVYKLFGGFAVVQTVDRRMSMRVSATDDVHAIARPLVDHLMGQMMADIVRDRPRSRKSYSVGWFGRMYERLEAAHTETYAEVGALVPTTDAAERHYVERYGRTARHSLRVDQRDYQAGGVRGSQADLGQSRVANTRRALRAGGDGGGRR